MRTGGNAEEIARLLADSQRKLRRLETRSQRRLITDYPWIRGWREDYMGCSYDPRITQVLNGADSLGRFLGTSGGHYQLRAGALAGRYAIHYLGNGADGFPSVRPSNTNWHIWCRMAAADAAVAGNQMATFGIRNVARTLYVEFGINTWGHPTNWMLQTNDGATNTEASAIAFDAAAHWLHLELKDGVAYGHLDGVLVVTNALNIPAATLTPYIWSRSGTADLRNLNVDAWVVVPDW